jgi:hypothetical protein
MLSLLAALLLVGGSSRAQPIESVDFRNHTYSLVRSGHSDTVALENGRAKFPDDPEVAPGISLLSVKYDDLDSDGLEEALVVLRYDSAGSALHYDYLFVFRMSPDGPEVWYSDRYESAAAISLVGNSVVVRAPLWLPRDAHCCPTYDARYTIRSGAGRLSVVGKQLYRRARST